MRMPGFNADVVLDAQGAFYAARLQSGGVAWPAMNEDEEEELGFDEWHASGGSGSGSNGGGGGGGGSGGDYQPPPPPVRGGPFAPKGSPIPPSKLPMSKYCPPRIISKCQNGWQEVMNSKCDIKTVRC